jgi:hypothetical protein
MDRLTVKQDIGCGITNYILYDTEWHEGRNKLGRIEDIEQQLGIEIVELFKAMTKGIDDGNIYNELFYDDINGWGLRNTVWDGYPKDKYVWLKDYNKTWFLTLEQAQAKLGGK